MNFFEILYAQKNGVTLPANFFDLLFAKSFTPAVEWGEYDGTLPAQYSANGSMLVDYRVYGSAGGVGDKTAQLFDPNAADVENGCYYDAMGGKVQNVNHKESGFIPVSPGDYTFSFQRKAGGGSFYVNFYDTSKNFVSNLSVLSGATKKVTITIQDYGYVRFNFADYFITRVMFGRGIDLSWVPYGYEVAISVSDGTTSTTTKLYIGDDPLDAIGDYADYVDYHEGKIVRSVLNYTFTGTEAYWRIIGASAEIFARNIAPNIVPNSAVRSYSPDGDVLFTHVMYGVSVIRITVAGISDGVDVISYLKSLYDNGTPAIMWYASSVPVEVDPPVPLPALPTVAGVTITDYAGQSAAPSRFYAKYRKG